MLDSWAFAHHYRRKRFLWLLYEYKLLQSARAIHALCDSEIREIRSLNITTPVALIPNGVDLPNPTSILPSPPWSGLIPQDARVMLFLGRFHSKKGIQPLIKAWHALASSVRQDNWWLVFVGYGDNGILKQQLLNTSISNVLVCDPAFGTVKQSAFSSASAFVLPSYSEGLPMAALEAMSFRLPCLLSHACNLPDAFSCGAAQVAEPSVDSLIFSFKQFFALSDCQRQLMGSAGFCLVKSRFSWSQVALQTFNLYQWINHAGPKPDFVHLV
jgi:poly(glycerol-phosphate) alpha-glucosyltransferase